VFKRQVTKHDLDAAAARELLDVLLLWSPFFFGVCSTGPAPLRPTSTSLPHGLKSQSGSGSSSVPVVHGGHDYGGRRSAVATHGRMIAPTPNIRPRHVQQEAARRCILAWSMKLQKKKNGPVRRRRRGAMDRTIGWCCVLIVPNKCDVLALIYLSPNLMQDM